MAKDESSTRSHLDFRCDLSAERDKLNSSIKSLKAEIFNYAKLNPKNESNMFFKFYHSILYRSVLSRDVSDQSTKNLKFLYSTFLLQIEIARFFKDR